MRNAIRLLCGAEAGANQAKCNVMEQRCLHLPQAHWQTTPDAFFIPAPLKWVVGSVARSVGRALERKNTASASRKISVLALSVGIFFRGADYGIGYFT
ncbi:hypothetical protein ACUSJC_13595 [Flavobacterium sp. U410]